MFFGGFYVVRKILLTSSEVELMETAVYSVGKSEGDCF